MLLLTSELSQLCPKELLLLTSELSQLCPKELLVTTDLLWIEQNVSVGPHSLWPSGSEKENIELKCKIMIITESEEMNTHTSTLPHIFAPIIKLNWTDLTFTKTHPDKQQWPSKDHFDQLPLFFTYSSLYKAALRHASNAPPGCTRPPLMVSGRVWASTKVQVSCKLSPFFKQWCHLPKMMSLIVVPKAMPCNQSDVVGQKRYHLPEVVSFATAICQTYCDEAKQARGIKVHFASVWQVQSTFHVDRVILPLFDKYKAPSM